jgi:methanethiol oxidase
MSRDGRRAYFTNSPHASWDEIFYPHGVDTSMARIDRHRIRRQALVPRFFRHGNDFRALRVHQTRLEAVDA